MPTAHRALSCRVANSDGTGMLFAVASVVVPLASDVNPPRGEIIVAPTRPFQRVELPTMPAGLK